MQLLEVVHKLSLEFVALLLPPERSESKKAILK